MCVVRCELEITNYLEYFLQSSPVVETITSSVVKVVLGSDGGGKGLVVVTMIGHGASLAVEGFVNSSEILEKLENRSDKGYHAVPPPFTGNYVPPKHDLRLINEHFESVYVDVISNIAPSDVKTVESKHKTVDVNHKVLTRSSKINNVGASVTTAVRPDKVLDLEKTKTAQAKEIADLKKRFKKFERNRRSRTPRMNLFKIGTFRRRSLGEDDASKQGRNLKQRLRSSRSIQLGSTLWSGEYMDHGFTKFMSEFD
nr:hypothetical protein [Tanacetum cinerariifolium]